MSKRSIRVKRVAGMAALGLAAVASALSLASVWSVSPSRVWPSLGWSMVACVAGLWAIRALGRRTLAMGDLIAAVEAEAPLPVLVEAPGKVRGGGIA